MAGAPDPQYGQQPPYGQPGPYPGNPHQQFPPPPQGQFGPMPPGGPMGPPQQSNTGMLIGIIAVVVVLLAGIGVAGFFLLNKDDDSGDDKSSSETDDPEKTKEKETEKNTDRPGGGGRCPESSPCEVGEVGTDGNDIDISMSKPEKGTLSDTACCPTEGDELYTFEVTFENNGSTAIELTSSLIGGTTESGSSATVSQVFDYGSGLEGIDGTLAPGDSKTAKVGFAMSPDVAKEEIIWEIQADYLSGDGVFFAATPAE